MTRKWENKWNRKVDTMLDKSKFLELLSSIVEIAATQDNTLTQEEIKEYFNGLELEAEHYDHIYAFLAENQITVKGFFYNPPAETPAEEEGEESKEDSKFLKMYLEDLESITRVSEGEEEVLLKQLISGEESVQGPLTENWLFKVVDIARTFVGKGALLEDLIQEGNMGLLDGIQDLLGRKDNIDGAEYLKESIEKAMMDYIDELNDGDDWSNTIVAKVNLLSEAAGYLAEELGRVATVKELSDYTKMSEEEINDILSLSLDAVETGTGELKMEESVTPKGNSIIDWNKM